MKRFMGIMLLSVLFAIPATTHAQETCSEQLNQKLDQVLSELQDIKNELQIIKVRASDR